MSGPATGTRTTPSGMKEIRMTTTIEALAALRQRAERLEGTKA